MSEFNKKIAEEIIEKWIKIGISCGTKIDRTAARSAIDALYKEMGNPPPKEIYYFDSPQAVIKAVAEHTNNSALEVYYQFCFGNNDVSYIAIHDYYVSTGVIEDTPASIALKNIAKTLGWFIPFENACVVSEMPTEICLNEAGQLHKDGGMALRYADGYGLYRLNGVEVSEHIAVTPADQLDPKLIISEKNVEVRREILRKIGTERAVNALSTKTLHADTILIGEGTPFEREERYELLSINLGGGLETPALKMSNPSVNATHIEFVGRDCKTVQDALAFRMQQVVSKFVAPKILT